MKRLLILGVLLSASMAYAQANYSTVFNYTENPISNGGNWTVPGGASHWTNVQALNGFASGVGAQPTQFGDYTALLTGTWGPDQTVQATVRIPTASTLGHEVELRLRSSLAGSSNTGYEAYCTVATGAAYCHIARWNGWDTAGSQTKYCNIEDTKTDLKLANGDVIKATVTGTTTTIITLFRQPGGTGAFTQIAQATTNATKTYTDGTDCGALAPFTTGNPGMGFWDGSTSSPELYMGFSAFQATDGIASAPTVEFPGFDAIDE